MANLKYLIHGVVVLYRPQSNFTENINSYIDCLDRLYVVDNTEYCLLGIKQLLNTDTKIEYIQNGHNLGIAKALNQGALQAAKNGADFILTMDQDSKASPDMIQNMIDCIDLYKKDNIGIVSPYHREKFDLAPKDKEIGEVLTVMTSGNLLNLDAYKIAGQFLEDLFIDFVDHEYCLRLRQCGFKIIETKKAILEHNLGQSKNIKIMKYSFPITNHSPLRRYYIARNRLFVMNKYKLLYPDFFKQERKSFFKDIMKVILCESQKNKKISMTFKGYLDYKKGIMGEYCPKV